MELVAFPSLATNGAPKNTPSAIVAFLLQVLSSVTSAHLTCL